MAAPARTLALSFGELTLPIECVNPETEKRIRAQLAKSGRQQVSLAFPPSTDDDVEGHAFTTTLRSVLVHARVGGAGAAEPVRIHFPSAQEAEHFRRNLVAAGLLAGTVVLGSIGVASLTATPAATGAASEANQVVDTWVPSQSAIQADHLGGPLSAAADQVQATTPEAIQAPRVGGPLSPDADQVATTTSDAIQAPRVGGPLSPDADQVATTTSQKPSRRPASAARCPPTSTGSRPSGDRSRRGRACAGPPSSGVRAGAPG